ncbi:hypothetical protein FHL15_003114 [Xylaria flabelliformis]|uniref:Uncharacterized protein n=1 Tax=Xylaria flabelliformis TaxID=2512241 RepID=A0A553I6Y6_9PEZI|nr:hypothetical protein FHL15_003114 [Xylaria flabelliformis]
MNEIIHRIRSGLARARRAIRRRPPLSPPSPPGNDPPPVLPLTRPVSADNPDTSSINPPSVAPTDKIFQAIPVAEALPVYAAKPPDPPPDRSPPPYLWPRDSLPPLPNPRRTICPATTILRLLPGVLAPRGPSSAPQSL